MTDTTELEDWSDAICRQPDQNPDLWFATDGHERHTATQLCTPCPHRWDCLEYALDNRIRWGVWGGATEEDRRSILRQQRRRAKANK